MFTSVPVKVCTQRVQVEHSTHNPNKEGLKPVSLLSVPVTVVVAQWQNIQLIILRSRVQNLPLAQGERQCLFTSVPVTVVPG